MPFSIRLTLACSIMPLFLLVQVCPQCYQPQHRSHGGVIPTCCVTASNATVRKPVDACFEQKENTLPGCKIHAYILSSGNNFWCVDPRAWWIQQRLQRLKEKKICCRIL